MVASPLLRTLLSVLVLPAYASSTSRTHLARRLVGNSSAIGESRNAAAPCFFVGTYEGSEDISLWRNGVAIASSGLFPSETQPGLMLSIDLQPPVGTRPTVRTVELRGVPAGFGFRPHGLFIDNSTQRLFVISHSEQLEEESIVVFDIESSLNPRLPVLTFRFALISPSFPWYPALDIWFLNDLAVVSDNELLVTQFGPTTQPLVPKHLWRCTWDETGIRPDGRLLGDCDRALADVSVGLNGMNANADKSVVWANDLFAAQLWVVDRDTGTGQLIRRDDMPLPGVIDNVEYDSASGDLAMGMIFGPTPLSGGGAIIARQGDDYAPFVAVPVTGTEAQGYAVSTSLEFDRWLVLGSPEDLGPVVCDMEAVHAAPRTDGSHHAGQ
jgi:hypothetical protein